MIRKFNGRALLADEMGLGKSLQSLYYAYKCPKKRPVIIVCPSSLKWVWKQEAYEHLGLESVILNGHTPVLEVLKTGDIFIINYEIVASWLPALITIRPRLIILDEVHYIKSRNAKRTRSVMSLCEQTPYIIAISGTPLTNKPIELFNTLHILNPKTFPSFFKFGLTYCGATKSPWGWSFDGATNIPQLHKILTDSMMIRRLKKDVLPELPDKIRQIIPLEIAKPTEYQKAKNTFIDWLASKSIEKAQSASRAEALVKIGYLKRLAAVLKLKNAFEWIDNFLENSDEKLVIYGIHKTILQTTYQKYKKIAVFVDGSVNQKDRQLAVTSFQNDDNTRIFIGNIHAAGTGLTLTAASTLVFVEIDYVPGNMTQAEDRIHRIGQTKAANVYYLVARDTIEEDLCKLITEKQKIITATLDGKETADYDLYSLLMKKLLQK